MTPSFEEGINSFAGILSSGLPWEIGLYGEVVEGEMASSEHPVMKAIWDGKIPVFNEPFAYQRVSLVKFHTMQYQHLLAENLFFKDGSHC